MIFAEYSLHSRDSLRDTAALPNHRPRRDRRYRRGRAGLVHVFERFRERPVVRGIDCDAVLLRNENKPRWIHNTRPHRFLIEGRNFEIDER